MVYRGTVQKYWGCEAVAVKTVKGANATICARFYGDVCQYNLYPLD